MSFLHLDPWNQVSKLRIGPSPGNKNRSAVLARILVKFGTGGEGKVGKNVGDRRRGCSGGRGWKKSGRGAARERGGAEGGVCAGGATVEKRGDSELELAGVRVGGGGVLGVWGGELARERGDGMRGFPWC